MRLGMSCSRKCGADGGGDLGSIVVQWIWLVAGYTLVAATGFPRMAIAVAPSLQGVGALPIKLKLQPLA